MDCKRNGANNFGAGLAETDSWEEGEAAENQTDLLKHEWHHSRGTSARSADCVHNPGDTLLQNIAGLCLQIGGLSKVLAGHPELTRERLKDLRQQGEHCMREARKAVWNIRSLESERLDLPTELRDQILRISQEAISNAARHARADTIELRVIFEAKCLQLQISDNGRGFDMASASELRGHFGLITMRERAIGIGASITVSSEPACGTCIDVKVPL